MKTKKGLITTIIGIIAIIGLAYNIYLNGGLEVQDVIILLTAIGLIAAKDYNGSHTKDPGHPPPDDED